MLRVRVKKNIGAFSLDADFSVPQSGVTVFWGKSGAGKTTLLNMIAGLIDPDEGYISCGEKVFFDSFPASGPPSCFSLPSELRELGYVFQQHRLFPHLSVRKNILFSSLFCKRKISEDNFERVVSLLGIGNLLERKPNSLSGGESQRVAIGRALLASTSFLLMDEPLSSLDQERKNDILGYISGVSRSFPVPIIYVTHSLEELSSLAGLVLEIRDGRTGALLPKDLFLRERTAKMNSH